MQGKLILMPKKDESKTAHWMNIHFKDNGGTGLKGVTKYDTAFLEEIDINSIKNTDLQISTIVEFCQTKKLPYRVMLMGKQLKDNKLIYEPGKIK